jgi:hypothetical protein
MERKESFWLTRIEPYLSRNILFVRGPDHVVSFPELPREKGMEVTEASTDRL